jgi:hypothetical protein
MSRRPEFADASWMVVEWKALGERIARPRVIAWAGVLLSVLMCLFPPWKYRLAGPAGYHFILLPPEGSVEIDFARLALPLVVVGGLAAAAIFLRRPPRQDQPKPHRAELPSPPPPPERHPRQPVSGNDAPAQPLGWIAVAACIAAIVVLGSLLMQGWKSAVPTESVPRATAVVRDQQPRPNSEVDALNAYTTIDAEAYRPQLEAEKRQRAAASVCELTKVDITKVASFYSANASVFGVMLGMSRDEAWPRLQLQSALEARISPSGKAWWVRRKDDGKEVMMLAWGDGNAIRQIYLRPEFGLYLQGDSKRLVTPEALAPNSELVRSYLGPPNKVLDETDPVLYDGGKWTLLRYCYYEKGIQFFAKGGPNHGTSVDLVLVSPLP